MKTYRSPAVASLQLIFEAFLTLEIELRVITIDIFVIYEFVKFPFKALTMIKEQEIVGMLVSSRFISKKAIQGQLLREVGKTAPARFSHNFFSSIRLCLILTDCMDKYMKLQNCYHCL